MHYFALNMFNYRRVRYSEYVVRVQHSSFATILINFHFKGTVAPEFWCLDWTMYLYWFLNLSVAPLISYSYFDSWLFPPLPDCPPDGLTQLDEPPYELSTPRFSTIRIVLRFCGRREVVANCWTTRGPLQS